MSAASEARVRRPGEATTQEHLLSNQCKALVQNSWWILDYPVQAKLHAAACDQVDHDNIWNTNRMQQDTANNDQIIANHMRWMTVPSEQQG